ncbi:MAG: nucleotidyltransferase family protein [Pseudomonadota bacterium]|nr:nucleotidyltransferase family protein [Pseudomonadota bacterium]
MIAENKLLFICIRKNFQHEHQKAILELCNTFEINWERVYSTAWQHQVIPLIYHNLSKCKPLMITPEVLAKFKADTQQFILSKLKQEQEIVKILSYFNNKSIDVMLIKGAALNFTVYQDFFGYLMGDTDLILGNKREAVSEQEDREDIVFFQQLSTAIEWERFQHHDVNRNNTLPIDFQKIWSKAQATTFKGQKVMLMAPEDTLLALCINSCRKRFFRLKSLSDIAATIDYFKELDWALFAKQVKQYRCQHIVYTALLVTALTLKIDLPPGVLKQFNIGWLRATVISLVIKYLYKRVSLHSLSPSAGKVILRKKINPALILIVLACNWFQFFKATSRSLPTGRGRPMCLP